MKIHAELKLMKEYQCTKCSGVQWGETKRVTLRDESPEGLCTQIKTVDLRAQFPIGWGSFADNVLICTHCLETYR